MKTDYVKEWRREHNVLSKAMSKEELKEAVRKDGTVQVKVAIPLDELLDESRMGVESDIATAITKEPEGLGNIKIELAGRLNHRVILKVTGEVLFDNL
jgi:hypothetical protein